MRNQSLFRKRPQIRRPQNKRKVPPLRFNPLVGHTVKLYPLNKSGGFKSTSEPASWPLVYGEVLKILGAMTTGSKGAIGQLKSYIAKNPNFNTVDTNPTFLAATYTIALWLGFITDKVDGAKADRLFENKDEYYVKAIAILIMLANNDTSVVPKVEQLVGLGVNGDNDKIVQNWKDIWNAAEKASQDSNYAKGRLQNYTQAILGGSFQFPSKAPKAKNKQFLAQDDNWLAPEYTSMSSSSAGGQSSTRQQSQISTIQKESLKQIADARISRFISTYGGSVTRVREMKPFAFNIFYSGRTGDIPTVDEWKMPAGVADDLTGINREGGMISVPTYLSDIYKKRNAIIVYARTNGNAQVFVTTASPASNLGRKHKSSGKYYIPVIEMTSFPQAAALIASGLVIDGLYKFSGKGTAFDKEDFPCCSPHTGFGQALIFARSWRNTKMRYRDMDILVYQQVGDLPQWLGADPGTAGQQYNYDRQSVWDTYQKEFDVPKEKKSFTREAPTGGDFFRNEEAPTNFVFEDVDVVEEDDTSGVEDTIRDVSTLGSTAFTAEPVVEEPSTTKSSDDSLADFKKADPDALNEF